MPPGMPVSFLCYLQLINAIYTIKSPDGPGSMGSTVTPSFYSHISRLSGIARLNGFHANGIRLFDLCDDRSQFQYSWSARDIESYHPASRDHSESIRRVLEYLIGLSMEPCSGPYGSASTGAVFLKPFRH